MAKVAFDVKVVPTSDGKFIPTEKWLRHDAFIRGGREDGGLQWPDWCEGAIVGSCKDEVCHHYPPDQVSHPTQGNPMM